MRKAHIDFETGSACNLTKAGVAVYTEDPSTRIWGFAWGFDAITVGVWQPGMPAPSILLQHVQSGGIVVAHNAAFERWIWNRVLRVKYEPTWPELRIEQQDCTMARAAAMTLPQGLDDLAKVLGQKNTKDLEGSKAMKRLMAPRKIHADGRMDWWDTEPGLVDRNMAYCQQDVRTEWETDTLVPALSPYERQVWELDQRVNDRGVAIDLHSVVRASELVDVAAHRADATVRRLTDNVVQRITNTAAIAEWINSRGIAVTTFRKGDHDDILELAEETGDEAVKAVVELRRNAAKTSVAKYRRMLATVSSDGRLRGSFNYHTAGPGRWGGRLVQLQNLPRIQDYEEAGVNYTVSLLSSRTMPVSDTYDLINLGVGEPMRWASLALRHMIVAGEGNKLVSGDFSNIEGVVNAWISGEEWKLSAFREYFAGRGADLYKVGAAKICGISVVDVSKAQRQAQGKIPELACGYQGGVGAFVTMGATYLLKPQDFVPPVLATATAQEWDETAIRYAKSPRKHGLPEDQWTAISIIVKGWRAAHPAIMQGWWDVQDAALEAIARPNEPIRCYGNRVTFLHTDGWLYCQLPSGRVLCYAEPFIKTETQVFVNAKGEEYERETNGIRFWGWSAPAGGGKPDWRVEHTYGGKLCENIVQAIARDVLVDRMFDIERAGYPIVMHVHDEIVSEVPEWFGSDKEYEALMSVVPAWAPGLPLNAKAWQDKRYIK